MHNIVKGHGALNFCMKVGRIKPIFLAYGIYNILNTSIFNRARNQNIHMGYS